MNIEEALEKLSEMFPSEDCAVDQMRTRFIDGRISIKSALIITNECFVADTFEIAFAKLGLHYENTEVLFW